MAKKQSRKQLGKRRQPTLKKQISSNLSKRANKLLEHYENIEALGKVGESNSESSQLMNKLGDIFNTTEEIPKDTFSSKVESVLGKLKTLKQLIIYNIMCTEDKKNFDTEEYRSDRMYITDTVFKIHATNETDSSDLIKMNKLYKKHKQVKQLFD
tara:strand:+ start:139 stop:603 length:465 start_codon:yes stop_codon:yes gene_type:complete